MPCCSSSWYEGQAKVYIYIATWREMSAMKSNNFSNHLSLLLYQPPWSSVSRLFLIVSCVCTFFYDSLFSRSFLLNARSCLVEFSFFARFVSITTIWTREKLLSLSTVALALPKKKTSKNWEPHKMDWSWFRMHCEGLPCALCSAREPKSVSHAFATDTFMHFRGCFLNNVRVIRHSSGEREAAVVPPVPRSFIFLHSPLFLVRRVNLQINNIKHEISWDSLCSLHAQNRNRSEF